MKPLTFLSRLQADCSAASALFRDAPLLHHEGGALECGSLKHSLLRAEGQVERHWHRLRAGAFGMQLPRTRKTWIA